MRILVLDDHRLFLEGVRSILMELPSRPEVVAFSSARSALLTIDGGEKFHLALVDLYLPGIDGLAFLNSLRHRRISLPVIIVSASTDEHEIQRAIKFGALGFVPKHCSTHQLHNAIETVLAGQMYLPDEFGGLTSPVYREAEPKPHGDNTHTNQLRGRRLEVLELIAEGHPNKSIANIINISEATVKSHIASLFKHFKVNNRTACVRRAQQLGLLKSKPR